VSGYYQGKTINNTKTTRKEYQTTKVIPKFANRFFALNWRLARVITPKMARRQSKILSLIKSQFIFTPNFD